MIDLTVKTLDSQNHVFSLADDITVGQFKEHIAETVNVSADSQRLIYCGRVLQDEKRLNEYDVNGKVIHLVQRAPPQSAQRGNSGGQSHGQSRNPDNQPQPRGMRYRQTRTQFHGNPMYLGSFSIPTQVVDDLDRPTRQVFNTWPNDRLETAEKMLDEANEVIFRLEDPAAAARIAAIAASMVSGSETASDNAPAEASQQDGAVNAAERLLQQLTGSGGPMGGIFEFATAVGGSRRPYVWPMRARSSEGSGAEPSAPTAETMSSESPSQPQDQQQQTPRPEGAANAGAEQQPRNPRFRSRTTPPAPRLPQMAEMLGRLMDTQDRLRPFLTRYRELMELDPEIPGGRTASGEEFGTVEENQSLADGVTECLHFLSHANHALSDIIVDIGQQPPRSLYCRAMVVQPMATFQAGIPIQVEAHISVARNDGSNGESSEENGDTTGTPPTSTSANPPTSQNPIDLTFSMEQFEPLISGVTRRDSDQPQQQQQQQQPQRQPQVNSPLGAIFNITNNAEVLMEMGPPESGGPTDGNASGTEQTQNNTGANNNNNNNAPGTSGIFPWVSPPPEVIRNLIHVAAGFMTQRVPTATTGNAAATTSTATPTTGRRQRVQVEVGSGAAPNPGQSTQARSNVGTHPTTSTRTRSTARPHVFHPHPVHPLDYGWLDESEVWDFDPYVRCKSHHLLRNSNAAPANNQQAPSSSSAQPAAQPTQAATSNGPGQTQPGASTTTAEENSTQPSTVSLTEEIAKLRESASGPSDDSNNEESDNSPTLGDLLLARGIRRRTWMGHPRDRSFVGHLLNLFTLVEVREWYAMLNDGRFRRNSTWHRLAPHLNCMFRIFTIQPDFREGTDHVLSGIVAELRPYYNDAFDDEERLTNVENGRTIDLPATLDAYWRHPYFILSLRNRGRDLRNLALYNNEWGESFIRVLVVSVRQLVSIVRFSMRRGQAGLESAIRYIFTRAMVGHHSEVREWVLGPVVDWLCEYSRGVNQSTNRRVIESLVYKDSEEVTASGVDSEVSRPQETPSEPEPEPMETEEVSSNRTVNDPLELDNDEEVPTTFPGHEALLPEWVPIIARDGIRQRRQLQLQGSGIGPFSDAYLDGLPSKRRKLVEQQKPRLLVSPTPNHSSIPASMERLVRENVVRAGVEEAEGAASAVAGDAGVRRAFGQAIRECLSPRRLQTPDFPDARRFPNATKFFAEKDAPAKQ